MRGLLVLVAACNGKADDSVSAVGDGDADTDADTDSATDVGEWTSIEGSLTYDLRIYGSDLPVDGEPVCDATIEFTGTPYTGPCPECDFLFEVTGTVVRDGGNGACPFFGTLSIHDNTFFLDDPFLLGFASEISYSGETYVDALVSGADSLLDGGVYVRPYTGGYKDYGTAAVAGDSFAWTFSVAQDKRDWDFYLYPYYWARCRYEAYSYAVAPYASGHTTYGSLPCADDESDVFSFRGVEGGTAHITVDTSDDPPLRPGMVLYGPEQCIETIAFGNFACSNGEHDCPSLSVDTVAGQYLLVVDQHGDCADAPGALVDYRLDIDAAWDPQVSQLRDDFPNGRRPATLEVTGTATLE